MTADLQPSSPCPPEPREWRPPELGPSVEHWLSLFRNGVPQGLPPGWHEDRAIWKAHRILAGECLRSDSRFPEQLQGRGIVICAGGPRYFVGAYVAAKMLRHVGCTLPIQFWHLAGEIDDPMRSLAAPLGVTCMDAHAVDRRRDRPCRILNGWELKCFAVLNSSYREVLLLDADNLPVFDPSFLFETPEYLDAGALFWPDYRRLRAERSIWEICDVAYRESWEFESGQLVIDKGRSWRALNLALHYNEHSDFYYRHVWGDKDTFQLAFLKTGTPFMMPSTPIHTLWLNGRPATMCQHDFVGRRLFQHRVGDKWRLDGANPCVADFWFEDLCRSFIEELAATWSGMPNGPRRASSTGPEAP